MLATMDMNGSGIGGIIGVAEIVIIMTLIGVLEIRERLEKWKRRPVLRVRILFQSKFLYFPMSNSRSIWDVFHVSTKKMNKWRTLIS